MIQYVGITDNINGKPGMTMERLDWNDLYNSFKINWQLNTAYEISFTATYTHQYADAFNMLKMKQWLYYQGQFYTIQQIEEGLDENGLPTKQVTANAILIDLMKNVRLDPKQPTEDNPDTSGGNDNDNGDSKQGQEPGIVVKRTDEQQTYTLQDRLDQFFNNNDQNIKYELHGSFPQAAVDCTGSLYEWLGSNLATFGAYYVPDNYVLKIYDLPSLRKPTDHFFRYLYNATNVNIQSDGNSMVNDCEVYGGKMEKDITSVTGGGAGGNLDSVEGFAKSPINADFGVNKSAMLSDFGHRDVRVRAWGVDVNKLYDTVKNAGVSPEWFFAYDLQEGNPTSYSWLNHYANHLIDPYKDAVRVCNWIKEWANSNTLTPASYGGRGVDSGTAAKWNGEFPKGTIGRVYLQGTAAAVWEMAGMSGGRYGKPLAGCVNQIRAWGGHTVQATSSDTGWGWPFPCGEGHFVGGQLFGVQPGGGFRPNGFHDGLDFGSIDHPGSAVHAIHGGRCIISRDYVPGVSWYCVIQDSSGLNVEYQEAFGSSNNITVNVGQQVKTGDVIGYRTTNHLHIGITRHSFREAFHHAYSNDGTWLDPLAMIKNGGGGGGSSTPSDNSGDISTSTTSETYYALHYHYSDPDSIKQYGIHRGVPIVMDSLYDMNALKAYVEATVQHDPPTTLTNNDYTGNDDYQLGDQAQLIVPEEKLNTTVTLMGINYNPFNPDGGSAELTWNNTGLAMKNSIYALHQDIQAVNQNVDQLNLFGATGARYEDDWANMRFTPTQVKDITDHSKTTLKGGGKNGGQANKQQS